VEERKKGPRENRLMLCAHMPAHPGRNPGHKASVRTFRGRPRAILALECFKVKIFGKISKATGFQYSRLRFAR
jgi:hypothetical protein